MRMKCSQKRGKKQFGLVFLFQYGKKNHDPILNSLLGGQQGAGEEQNHSSSAQELETKIFYA